MVGSSECVVSFGSEIQIHWSDNQNGSISISLRHVDKGIRLHPETSSTQKWTFRAATDRATDDQNEDDGSLRKLSEKIEKEWRQRRQTVEQNIDQWSRDPSTFLGNVDFTSSEQWSCSFLSDSEKKLHLERVPFHKANLSRHLKRRIEISTRNNPEFLESNCRRSMMAAMYPGYETNPNRKTLWKKFERYIAHGNFLLEIASVNPGLLLIAARSLTTQEYVSSTSTFSETDSRSFQILSNYSKAPSRWLSAELLEDSTRYAALGSKVLEYMDAEPETRGSPVKRRRVLPGASQRPLLTPEASQEDSFVMQRPEIQIEGPLGTLQPFQVSTQSSSPSPTQQDLTSQGPLSQGATFGSLTIQDERGRVLPDNCLEDASYLVLLFHALGGSVPQSLFVQALPPQVRWNDEGMEQEFTALDAGLDQRLIDILSNEEHVNRVIGSTALFANTNGSWTFLDSQFENKLSQMLSSEEKEKWTIKALRLICFVFPQQLPLDSPSQHGAIVRPLLPLLGHARQAIKRINMSSAIREEVSGALLAACKAGNNVQRDVLATVAELVDDKSPLHLRAGLVWQQSVSSRLSADFDRSELLIHDFCCRCGKYEDTCIPKFYRQHQPDRVSKRLNALYGRIHGSHLENLVQCEKYDFAIEQVDDWQVPTCPSLLENCVGLYRTVTVSMIFRSQGSFIEARTRLELCLKFKPQQTNRVRVLCSLADVYCDLGLSQEARTLIAPEIEKRATKSKAYRRLLVSMVDTNIQQHLYDDARKTITELDGVFDKMSNLDVSDQLLHIRVLVALGRVYQYDSKFDQAIQRWKVALPHLQKYSSFKGEGFTYAAIHLSLSLAYLKSGNLGEARASFDCAKEILSRGKRDYWIPTLMTWVDETLSEVQSETSWLWN